MSSPFASVDPFADPFTLELQRIRGLIEVGQLQPAAQALNAAQKQAPTDARVPLVGMRLAQQAGNVPAAIQAARKALALAPDWHVAQIELALMLAKDKQGDEALSLAMQALANEPLDKQVMIGAINVALYAERIEQTRRWAEDGVRRFPDELGIRLFLARFLASQDEYALAREHYAHVQARLPQHDETLRGLLDCALHEKDDEQARQWADLDATSTQVCDLGGHLGHSAGVDQAIGVGQARGAHLHDDPHAQSASSKGRTSSRTSDS